MKYIVDHDLHIHSRISPCAQDERQTKEYILQHGVSNHLKRICVTDHFWDSAVMGAENSFYAQYHLDYDCIAQILPLPQDKNTAFYFGCETDLNKHMTLGLSRHNYDKFDFIIVPTNHMHLKGFCVDERDSSQERLAELYVQRLHGVLDMDLPFEKVGFAHLTLQLHDSVSDETFEGIFKRIAEKEAGVELNFWVNRYSPEELPRVLRPYIIAKACGCKFYLGSDAHSTQGLQEAMGKLQAMVDVLELEENDKFIPSTMRDRAKP